MAKVIKDKVVWPWITENDEEATKRKEILKQGGNPLIEIGVILINLNISVLRFINYKNDFQDSKNGGQNLKQTENGQQENGN